MSSQLFELFSGYMQSALISTYENSSEVGYCDLSRGMAARANLVQVREGCGNE